jgi:phosphoglycerate dehydrogenase-like enzyme
MRIVVSGSSAIDEVPGLESAQAHAEVVFAPNEDELAKHLPGSEILLGWNFKGRDLESQWQHADRLKWIHWCGAGVDAVLFSELISSDVTLTNARGIFDRAMAEYVLGYMLSEVKGFHRTWEMQQARTWDFRLSDKLDGSRAVIFGVGSIGREIARMLKAAGINVSGVGRHGRRDDPVFGNIHPSSDVLSVIANADWVIGVMPLTEQTKNFFGSSIFGAMKPSARFINVGRGQSVDEEALVTALNAGQIAGAMLDVFQDEPLPQASPLWTVPNLMISPHMSGDYKSAPRDMVAQFLENLERFIAGELLANVVNKKLGFVQPR